jgi:Exostosin family
MGLIQLNQTSPLTMLKFYTNHTDLSALSHIPLLPLVLPFVQTVQQEEQNSWECRYADYQAQHQQCFSLTSLADCQVVILPYDWFWVRGYHWLPTMDVQVVKAIRSLSAKLAAQAAASQKPLFVFFMGDRSHEAIDLPNTIIFREGLYQSRRSARDFALPAFCEDLLTTYYGGELQFRPYRPQPTVGFCGLAKPNSLKNLAKFGVYQAVMLASQGHFDVSPHKGELLRVAALAKLRQHPAISTNFIIRGESVFFGKPFQAAQDCRLEYVTNMLESDYILCCRGSGNYSYRLYETLCMGRIPVFINTDCVLPFDFVHEWRDYIVWVEESELEHLPEKILAFHQSLTPQTFSELQQACRSFWLNWLSPQGFLSNLTTHLSHIKSV